MKINKYFVFSPFTDGHKTEKMAIAEAKYHLSDKEYNKDCIFVAKVIKIVKNKKIKIVENIK
jgi:hypothetical protein